jgi:uncharacterized membrane protein
METVLNVLHVLTAVFIVGPMALLPMTAMRAIRGGDGAQVTSLAQSTNVLSLASLIVVFFGFGLMSLDKEVKLSITTPWILSSLILYIVALALSVAVVVPAMRSAGEHLTADAPVAEGGNDYKRIAMTSGVVSLLLMAVVVLMVARP